MGERIKAFRKAMKMRQSELAEALSVSQGALSQYENGLYPMPENLIELICHKYHVSYEWLKSGEGEMFPKPEADEVLTDFFADILNDDESFKRRIVKFLAELPPEAWDKVEKKARELLTNGK